MTRRPFLVLLALAGCGLDAVGSYMSNRDGGTPEGGTPYLPDASLPDAGGPEDAAVDSDAAPPPPVFFVTTETELFEFSPVTKEYKHVGPISAACPQADELALSSAGELYASSNVLRALYRFDTTTFACAKVGAPDAGEPFTYALSFVPKETFDAGEEPLVGYDGADFIRVDRTGHAEVVRAGALLEGMRPSGDIVAAAGTAFASMTGSVSCLLTDCLVEIDPASGIVTKNWGNFPGDRVYAIAYWGGKVYGFRNTGEVYEVTLTTPLTVTTLPAPDGGAAWVGAGSSPRAPTQ